MVFLALLMVTTLLLAALIVVPASRHATIASLVTRALVRKPSHQGNMDLQAPVEIHCEISELKRAPGFSQRLMRRNLLDNISLARLNNTLEEIKFRTQELADQLTFQRVHVDAIPTTLLQGCRMPLCRFQQEEYLRGRYQPVDRQNRSGFGLLFQA